MKKLVALLLFIFLLFGLYILISQRPHDYAIKYMVDGFKINEKYTKNNAVYSFTINDNSEDYIVDFKEEYHTKRKLITSVTKDDNCISISSILINKYIICKNEGEYFTSFYDDKMKYKKSDYFEGVDIYDLKNNTYFVWNYNHLIALKKDNYSKINLFKSDVYKVDLYYQFDKYLLIPNYDEKYMFSMMYLINSNNYKVSKIPLNISIYYDSYFLGNYDNDIYIYDHKKELEYRINPFKKTVSKNRYEYFDNNKWLRTNKKALNSESVYFNQTKDFYFIVDNNYLTYITPDYRLKVSNVKVDYLVNANDKEAFFINGDSLYYVNIYSGIHKVIGYKEWNYNKGNVFVF